MPAAPATTAAPISTCPERLSAEDLGRFREDGFLAFEDFLAPGEVEGLKAAIANSLRDLHENARQGKAVVKASDWERLRNYSGMQIVDEQRGHSVLFEPDVKLDVRTASFEELDRSYRKLSDLCKVFPDLARLAAHPRLVSLLEGLLGPQPILYGDQALCKPAFIGSAKPWHQDSAYFVYEPYDMGVDVWIALDDATLENGCMTVLPGAHKLGPKQHVHRDDCTIADGRLDYSKAQPVELRSGGLLLFHVLLPHYTPENRSPHRRRSIQFFYRGAQTRLITREEKAARYLEADGTPASCAAAKKG